MCNEQQTDVKSQIDSVMDVGRLTQFNLGKLLYWACKPNIEQICLDLGVVWLDWYNAGPIVVYDENYKLIDPTQDPNFNILDHPNYTIIEARSLKGDIRTLSDALNVILDDDDVRAFGIYQILSVNNTVYVPGVEYKVLDPINFTPSKVIYTEQQADDLNSTMLMRVYLIKSK